MYAKELIKERMIRRKWMTLAMAVICIVTAMWFTQITEDVVKAYETGIGENDVISTDFSEYEVGEGVPEGWKELWATSDYEIAESPSRLVKTSTGDPRHLLAWEDVGKVEGDVELATLIRVPDVSRPVASTTRFQLHLHAGGEAGAINTYHVDYTGTEGNVRIRRSVDHSQTTLASASQSFEMGGWHHVVFQRSGDMLRAKIWPYFSEEPEEWTVEAEDDQWNSGRVGLGYFSQEDVTQEFAWFSVGTGKQEAERAPDNLDGIPTPQVPDMVEANGEAKYGAVVLNWDEVAGAEHYEVERNGELIARGWENTSYADPNIKPGTSATYRVRGVNTLAGEGEWSTDIEVESDPIPDELARPFEQEDGNPWTTHEQELAFLDELEEVSPRVGVEEIGRSGEDRPIHLVRFGVDGPPNDEEIAERPTVLLVGGNHGDEKGSREGVLFHMRELATSQDPAVLDFLDTYAMLVMPTINPDGVEANTRNAVNPNLNINRDFVSLVTSEAQAVTKVLRDHEPDVVIDAHEWRADNGWQRGELEVSTTGNLNAHEDVLNLSSELAFDRVMAESNEHAGWRSKPYAQLSGWSGILHRTSSLKHALTFLTESSRHPEVRRLEEVGLNEDAPEFRPRRVASQRFALSEAMRWMTENVDRVTAATSASAAAAKANEGPVYTGGSVAAPPSSNDILDPPPCGWLLTGVDETVSDVLDLHGIEWENRNLPRPTSMGQEVTFVPAAQLARPFAVVALDSASPDQLSSINSLRLEEESGWCDPQAPGDPDPGDKTELQNRVEEIHAENLHEEDYTEESWENLQNALTTAEDVLNHPEATQAEIDAALEDLNEARAGLMEVASVSVERIKELVERFEDEGAFTNDEVPRSLLLHLTAVSRYENQGAAEKIVKHMEGFKDLLNHQQANELISEEAYHTLIGQADALIEKWE